VKGPILGWDIGGANIKAALIDGESATPVVVERPFALWREPQRLRSILVETADSLPTPGAMAVTMTAELADCFATKREGVAFVLDALRAAFPDVDPWIYGVDGRFRSLDAAYQEPYVVAAANWMASATLAAQTVPDAIFIDVGSTTTDVIPIVGGRVVAVGRTDPDRLRSGELVYTGALRTPVCAIVSSVPLRGDRCRIAAEHFAIAADVHRWLAHIEECDYRCETPDGRGRSRSEAGARLARMVCADLEMIGAEEITIIAEHVARAQAQQIAAAVRDVSTRLGSDCPHVAILAGHGAFLARAALEDAGLEIRDQASTAAAQAAPAVAVAYLLGQMAAI
jgi:probable H4MPT-linked C1 transfer pathway protein